MRKLIIAEKPKVAERIARAISRDFKRKRFLNVPYYYINKDGKEIFIAPAAGHLFALAEKKKSFAYPVFDIEWKPLYEIDKTKKYTKRYISLLKSLAKNVDEFVIATDYDIEGELLGYNALRFACGAREARRMKFSTLVERELKNAYENLVIVDYALANAGEARHILDWFYGINVSRALMLALSKTGKKQVLSAGRVQTPALAILVKREREISEFVPEKFYKVFAELEIKGKIIKAEHEKGRIKEKEKAREIVERAERAEKAIVSRIAEKDIKIPPPVPFDLGELQAESYRIFKYSPKKTQDIAQSLYESGYISYPRTSSQKLPLSINFRSIIKALSKIGELKNAEKILAKSKLIPRQGKKEDPAHPAIYPTGVIPKNLGKDQEKIYMLICHRFLACFADAAEIKNIRISFNINSEIFLFSYNRIIKQNWLEFYPYASIEHLDMPEIEEGEIARILKIYAKESKTKPPRRYTPASLIKKLEELNLGTKATRAEIVETLYSRRYIEGREIKVTELGFAVIEALEKYVPELISEKLTRKFEEELELISLGKTEKEKVLKEAKEHLEGICSEFKKNEAKIGEFLKNSLEVLNKKEIIGKCKCGGDLIIRRSKKTRKIFIGCSSYPKCNISFPLPQSKKIKATNELCKICGMPMISLYIRGRKVLSCINMECSSKN